MSLSIRPLTNCGLLFPVACFVFVWPSFIGAVLSVIKPVACVIVTVNTFKLQQFCHLKFDIQTAGYRNCTWSKHSMVLGNPTAECSTDLRCTSLCITFAPFSISNCTVSVAPCPAAKNRGVWRSEDGGSTLAPYGGEFCYTVSVCFSLLFSSFTFWDHRRACVIIALHYKGEPRKSAGGTM